MLVALMALTRKPMRRALPRSGARLFDPVTEAVYQTVRRRASGVCEVGPAPGHPCRGRYQWHHRREVKNGGGSVASNGLWVCEQHHAWVHSHPACARENGWLVSRYDNPGTVAVLLPRGRWRFLDDDGHYVADSGPGGPGEGRGEAAGAQMPPPGPDQGRP